MRIIGAKVIVCCPSRNFVTLKLETESGVYGLGDATLNGRELAVVAFLEAHCIPALIGRDARNIEDIWHFFYRGVYWRRGPVSMAALSAIDVALWDIKAKALSTPLYNLIGGRSRERLLVYAHATGDSLSSAVQSAVKNREKGYRAIRIQAAIPGLSDTYGVGRDNVPYEPAKPGLAPEECWDTARYLSFMPELFAAVRRELGTDVHLLHDVHHRCTPIEAARLAKELEPYHLWWLEDPVAGELQEGLRLIRKHSTTPIAIGEVFNTVYDYTTLLTEQLIDYIRMPPSHGGGITHLMKVAALAAVYHVKTGFHGATDISPVGLAASLHVGTALNNFGIQEHMPHQPSVDEVFSSGYRFDDGALVLDERPGLGVDIDELRAADFPYQAAALPINRLADGTLWHW